MHTTMTALDAIELVELRLVEDKISFKVAIDEFRQLTGCDIRDCKYLKLDTRFKKLIAERN